MAVTDLYTVLEERIPLLFNKSIMDLEPQVEPLFNTITTSEGVTFDGASRNWTIRKKVRGAVSGNIEADPGATPQTIYGPDPVATGHFYWNSLGSEYPDPFLSPNARVGEMQVTIRAFRGSFELSLHEMRHESLDSFVGNLIPYKIRGVARQLAAVRAAHFYAEENSATIRGVIGTIAENVTKTAVSASGTVEAHYMWGPFAITGGTITRFQRGMMVDVWNSDFTTQSHVATNPMYVWAADYMTDKLTLIQKDQSDAGSALDFTAGMLITTRKNVSSSTGYPIDGINAWLKGSGTLYNLALADWPEFKSFMYTDSGALTETKLGRYFDRTNKAFKPYGYEMDTVIMSSGTHRAAINAMNGMFTYERNGSTLSMNNLGTSEGISYTHNGRKYTIQISDNVPHGTVYGLKVSGNLKRYVPPRTPGVGSLDNFGQYWPVEFIGTAVGLGSIWDNRRGTNNIITNTKYAPFDYRMNVVPDKPCGMKITGLADDYITG